MGTSPTVEQVISPSVYLDVYSKMVQAKALNDLYSRESAVVYKYVHATSRGHEAVQLAMGMQLKPCDYVAPYYRDDALLLGMGITPRELMQDVLVKPSGIFSGGRHYYCHPSLKREDLPKIPYQSSATGMQAIPITGVAMGLMHKELMGQSDGQDFPIAVCSIGDGAMTEGEVSEALHMATLKKLPIIYLVQDNEWSISAKSDEIRANDVDTYAKGFNGMHVISIDGTDFEECYKQLEQAISHVRLRLGPVLVHAKVPLLGHHTSGVRKEMYRDDLLESERLDPLPRLRLKLLNLGMDESKINALERRLEEEIEMTYELVKAEDDPDPSTIFEHIYADSPITEEQGQRCPDGAEATMMVDSGVKALEHLMEEDPSALFYGQDVGGTLGGVFREAAGLTEKFGEHRVFNTPIQEAFIVGSTAGMSAVGLKAIVELQFADYMWPALNQLFTELSRSNYLSNGKWPINSVIRVPIGAYGGGGPFHSSSIESVLSNIIGIKVVYPSCGADLYGLLRSAAEDPNPVVVLEHKGLYFGRVKHTDYAKSPVPERSYRLPIGKAHIVQKADALAITEGKSALVITYGMGVHWALASSESFKGKLEIIDLRTVHPVDLPTLEQRVKIHGKAVIVTEEPVQNGLAQGIASRLTQACFEHLDAPIKVMGSENTPAIPLQANLEAEVIMSAKKLEEGLHDLFNY